MGPATRCPDAELRPTVPAAPQEQTEESYAELQEDRSFREEERLRHQRSRNLHICLYLIVGRQLQSTIGLRDFMDIYLYEISGVNEFVGKVESTTGILRLLALLPFGMLTDKLDRVCLLKTLAALKLLPMALILAGTAADSIGLLWPGLVCLSIVDAGIDLLLQVVIVDNVPEPERRIFVLSRKEMATWASSALGPLLATVLLLVRNAHDWSRSLLRSLIQGGLLLYIVTEPAAFLLRTVRSLACTDESGASCAQTSTSPPAHMPLVNTMPAWTEERVLCGVRKRWMVPIWADIVWAATQVGATVSLRYIPLFFKRDFSISPAGLMVLRVLENGSLALLNYATPAITQRLGRGVTCVLLVLAGGLFMYGVAMSHSALIAALLFVLRTCTARAWLPPLQAIIFECVAAEHRGRWSVVTSFKSATNGLGAWLGGALADRTGDYRTGFVLTASVQCLSALAFVPVVLWLPRHPGGSH